VPDASFVARLPFGAAVAGALVCSSALAAPVTTQTCTLESVDGQSRWTIEASDELERITAAAAGSAPRTSVTILSSGIVVTERGDERRRLDVLGATLRGLESARRAVEQLPEYAGDKERPVRYVLAPEAGAAPQLAFSFRVESELAAAERASGDSGSLSASLAVAYPPGSPVRLLPVAGGPPPAFLPARLSFGLADGAGEAEVTWWQEPSFPKSVVWRAPDRGAAPLRRLLTCDAPVKRTDGAPLAAAESGAPASQEERDRQNAREGYEALHAAEQLAELLLPEESLAGMSKAALLRQVGYGAHALCSAADQIVRERYWSLVDAGCVRERLEGRGADDFIDAFARPVEEDAQFTRLARVYAERLRKLPVEWKAGLVVELDQQMRSYCGKASAQFLRSSAIAAAATPAAVGSPDAIDLDELPTPCTSAVPRCDDLQTIRKRLDAAIAVPEEARHAWIPGDTVVEFGVGGDGAVTQARVVGSSCSPVLDEAALAAAKRAAPFPLSGSAVGRGELRVRATVSSGR
jgi:TonB family protein